MTACYIVTGASSGIGREICRQLLEAGHDVVGIARDIDKFNPGNLHYRGIAMDLAQLDELPAHLSGLVRRYHRVAGIVLCAGMGRFGALEEFSYDQIRALIDINLVSQVFFARAFLPLMKRQASGDLVLIGSESGIVGGRYGSVYSATKFALRGFAQSLRQECASRGVRVTVINPGMVKTEFFSALRFEPGADEENYILPEDVAEMVLHVLSFRRGSVVDEINMSPLKKVVRTKKR
jgi:NADP-dependent 3-hydroxy acid dehydrogenase YdfG